MKKISPAFIFLLIAVLLVFAINVFLVTTAAKDILENNVSEEQMPATTRIITFFYIRLYFILPLTLIVLAMTALSHRKMTKKELIILVALNIFNGISLYIAEPILLNVVNKV